MGLLDVGVVAGVFVGWRRLHGSYTTASTAAALGFQPVVPETVARSLKAAGFLGVARGSWDFRRMESRAIRPIIAQRMDPLQTFQLGRGKLDFCIRTFSSNRN